MANLTYTWKVTSLKIRNEPSLNGVVFQTYWKKIGTDSDGDVGEFSGATPFDPSQVDPNNFTPFEELTEEIVLGWIKNVVVGSYEEHVNTQIQKQIDAKKNPVEEVNDGKFPWDPPITGSATGGALPI